MPPKYRDAMAMLLEQSDLDLHCFFGPICPQLSEMENVDGSHKAILDYDVCS